MIARTNRQSTMGLDSSTRRRVPVDGVAPFGRNSATLLPPLQCTGYGEIHGRRRCQVPPTLPVQPGVSVRAG